MKPVWKWVIGVAAGFVVLVVTANWYANHALKPKMEAELKTRVVDGTDGRYRLAYDQLEVSLLLGDATATNVRLLPDTSVASEIGGTYEVRLGQLRIRGVGMLRLLLTGALHVNTIALDTPRVRMVRRPQADTTAADTVSGSMGQRLVETLSGTRVKHITIRAGEFERVDQRDATHLHVQQINTDLRDIRIDSAAMRDRTRLYGVKFIQVDVEGMTFIRPDSLYRLQTGPLHLETTNRELVLHDIRYGLLVSKAAFYRQVQRAEDIGDVAIARVILTGIDIPRWVGKRTIAASALQLDSGHVAVYKDKTQPNPLENKIGKSPHQLLMGLEQRVAIDSVLANALDISFTEVSDQTGKAGTVTFEATNALIRNATNDSAALAHDRFMRLHAQTRAMGVGDLTVDFRFDLLDTLGAHTYRAELDAMSGTAFNRMLKPHLNVEIERAAIRQLRFDMVANDRRTAGTLQLDYDNLKVNMLREDPAGGTAKKPLVSFFANRFLLNDSNPDANGVHHTGQVYIERPPTFSFFKMIWRSIREGTKECIGLR